MGQMLQATGLEVAHGVTCTAQYYCTKSRVELPTSDTHTETRLQRTTFQAVHWWTTPEFWLLIGHLLLPWPHCFSLRVCFCCWPKVTARYISMTTHARTKTHTHTYTHRVMVLSCPCLVFRLEVAMATCTGNTNRGRKQKKRGVENICKPSITFTNHSLRRWLSCALACF